MGGNVSFPIVSLSESRIFIVTGANTGIGYEVAKWIAMRGATVIMACRSEEKAKEAIQRMNAEYKELRKQGTEDLADLEELRLEYMKLDLASFQSVKEFVRAFEQSGRKLHVLICNAGVISSTLGKTEDGFESTVQVNYLNHFLLIGQLLPLMKMAGDEDSRIVLVSGDIYRIVSFDTNQINYNGTPDKYGPITCYARSKLYQIMLMYCLRRRLRDTNISVTSLHPGVVDTQMVQTFLGARIQNFSRFLGKSGFLKTPKEGAKCTVFAAVSPELLGVSGIYLKDCREVSPSATARDETKQEELWRKTLEYLKEHLTEEEVHCLEGDYIRD